MEHMLAGRRGSNAVAQVLGQIRLRRFWELEAMMEQAHNPLDRAFGSRETPAAVLDFIARELTADREAERRRRRDWLASARFAEEV